MRKFLLVLDDAERGFEAAAQSSTKKSCKAKDEAGMDSQLGEERCTFSCQIKAAALPLIASRLCRWQFCSGELCFSLGLLDRLSQANVECIFERRGAGIRHRDCARVTRLSSIGFPKADEDFAFGEASAQAFNREAHVCPTRIGFEIG